MIASSVFGQIPFTTSKWANDNFFFFNLFYVFIFLFFWVLKNTGWEGKLKQAKV